MRTRRSLAGVLLILTLVALPTSEAVDDPTAKRIAGLIARLGSPRFEDRETATRELESLGQLALPALEKAAKSNDLETQRRAKELVAKFQGRLNNARLLAASRVRLTYQGTPLQEAIADLAKKTGYTVLYADDEANLKGRTVTLDTGETTFWQAFDQFCRAASIHESLMLRPGGQLAAVQVVGGQAPPANVARPQRVPNTVAPVYGSYRQIILMDGKEGPLPTDYREAVRVRSLAPEMQLHNAPAPVVGEQRFLVDVSPEPRIDLQRIIDLRVDRAVDEQGQARKAVNPAAAVPVRPGVAANVGSATRAIPRQILVRLEKGEKPSRVLKEFEGTVTALFRTSPKVLATVEKVLEAAGKTTAGERGIRLTLKEVKKHADGRVEVQAVIERPSEVYGYTSPAPAANGGAAGPVGRPQVQPLPVQVPAQPNAAPKEVPPGAPPPNPAPQPKQPLPIQPAPLPVPIQPIQVKLLPAQGQILVAGARARAFGTAYFGLSLLDDKNERFPISEVRGLGARTVQGTTTQEVHVTFNPGMGQGSPAKLIFTGTWNEAVEVPFKLKDVPLN